MIAKNNQVYDTIIVGGGFAGVSAARELHRSNKSILLLEARERLGGRVHSIKVLDGIDIELGGQWIGPSQYKMYELVKEFGIETYRTYDKGKCVLDLNQKITTYTGLIPKVDPWSLWNIDRCVKRLDKMAKSLSLDAPWLHPNAAKWDSMTLETFLQKQVKTKKAMKIVKAGLETVLACCPNEVSLLHVLFYIKSGRNINTLLSIENGAQQDRIVGGMQQIVEKMVEPFKASIQFGEIVQKIEQEKKGCTVITSKGHFQSKKIIVAVPPVLAGRIQYAPTLSLRKQQLLQKIPMGIVAKCYAIYKKPFWREKGFSGEAVTDERIPYQTLFDNAAPDAPYGVIMGFCLADRATRLMPLPLEKRRQRLVETLTRYFGEEAKEIWHYEDKYWAEEEFSQGCYTGYFPPGIWTQYQDEIRNPEGNIHWAGTETATIWNGYIEGAVLSGIRAAQEILT